MSGELYLILHRVRGEPAFDIAARLDIGSAGGWIIPTSGHRAYPYRWWTLEDLADISDINRDGSHDRPASLDHTLPLDWPDHYRQENIDPRARAKPIDPGLMQLLSDMESQS
jgi:hypothetical protein